MDLGEARAAERRRIDRDEELPGDDRARTRRRARRACPRTAEDTHFRLKLGELVAVRARQNLGTRRERLPDLHERRAEVLEHRAKLLGRHRVHELVFANVRGSLRARRVFGERSNRSSGSNSPDELNMYLSNVLSAMQHPQRATSNGAPSSCFQSAERPEGARRFSRFPLPMRASSI